MASSRSRDGAVPAAQSGHDAPSEAGSADQTSCSIRMACEELLAVGARASDGEALQGACGDGAAPAQPMKHPAHEQAQECGHTPAFMPGLQCAVVRLLPGSNSIAGTSCKGDGPPAAGASGIIRPSNRRKASIPIRASVFPEELEKIGALREVPPDDEDEPSADDDDQRGGRGGRGLRGERGERGISISSKEVLKLFGEVSGAAKPVTLRIALDGEPQFSDFSARLYPYMGGSSILRMNPSVMEKIVSLLPPGARGTPALMLRKRALNYVYDWRRAPGLSHPPVLVLDIRHTSAALEGAEKLEGACNVQPVSGGPCGGVRAAGSGGQAHRQAGLEGLGVPRAVVAAGQEEESSHSDDDPHDSTSDEGSSDDEAAAGPSVQFAGGGATRTKQGHLFIPPTDVSKLFGAAIPPLPMPVEFKLSIHGLTLQSSVEAKLCPSRANGVGLRLRVPRAIGAAANRLLPWGPPSSRSSHLRRSNQVTFNWSFGRAGSGKPWMSLDVQPNTTAAAAMASAALWKGAGAHTDGQKQHQKQRLRDQLLRLEGQQAAHAHQGLHIPSRDPRLKRQGLAVMHPPASRGLDQSRKRKRAAYEAGKEQEKQKVRHTARLQLGAPWDAEADNEAAGAASPGGRATGSSSASQGVGKELRNQLRVLEDLHKNGLNVQRYWRMSTVRRRKNSCLSDRRIFLRCPDTEEIEVVRSFLGAAKFVARRLQQLSKQPQARAVLPVQAAAVQPPERPVFPRYPSLVQQAHSTSALTAAAGSSGGDAREKSLRQLSRNLEFVAAQAASAPELRSNTQRLLAVAIAMALGADALHLDAVQQLLADLPSAMAPTFGGGSTAPARPSCSTLALLAGAISVLPAERIQQAATQLGMDARSKEVHGQLLAMSARAAAEMAGGAASGAGAVQRQVGITELGYLQTQAQQLRNVIPLDLLRNPMRVLLPAYKQVWQQGPLVCILAECLGHAQAGRVSAEQEVQHRVTGNTMRLLSQAAGGGQSGWDSLVQAVQLALTTVSDARAGLAAPEAIPDAVIYALLEPEVQEVRDIILARHPGLQQELDRMCVTAGYALYSRHVVNLVSGLASVLQLVYGEGAQAARMDVQLAVAAVAAGQVAEAGADVHSTLLVQLLNGFQGLGCGVF